MEVKQDSLYLPDGDHQLHIRHIRREGKRVGEPVLMIHGAIENGKIFYSHKGKGLACFLAAQGFDVYVMDLRGRGDCKPRIQPNDQYGQTDTICHDIPLVLDFVHQRNTQPIHLIAHSWGGVLASAMLIRFPHLVDKIKTQVYFGTKRRVSAFNLEVIVKIKFMWHFLAPKITKRLGLLPAKKMGFGSDDETIKSHGQGMKWTKTRHWIDEEDGFDYQQHSAKVNWPPTWFVAAIKDKALGHPNDVKRFMNEANYDQANYVLLAEQNGNKLDYDHINMLTHGECIDDHFTQLLTWLARA